MNKWLIEYIIDGFIGKKALYYFLLIVVVRYCIFFYRRGLKWNLILGVFGVIVVSAIWEQGFRTHIGNPWIFHVIAIVIAVFYVAVSFKRIYSGKDNQEKKKLIRSFVLVLLELTVIFLIIFWISKKTDFMFF